MQENYLARIFQLAIERCARDNQCPIQSAVYASASGPSYASDVSAAYDVLIYVLRQATGSRNLSAFHRTSTHAARIQILKRAADLVQGRPF